MVWGAGRRGGSIASAFALVVSLLVAPPSPLASTPAEASHTPGALGGTIAFASGSDIWLVEADAPNTEVQLTTDGAATVEGGAVISPDGTKVAFIRNGDVWIVNSDGTSEALEASSTTSSVDWSPDGTKLAYGEIDELVIRDVALDTETRVVPAGGGASVSDVSWSPTDDFIYFMSNAGGQRELYRIDVATLTSVTMLTNGGALDESVEPRVSPDGTKVLFLRLDVGEVRWFDASGPAFPISPATTNAYFGASNDYAWSPDGAHVASIGATSVAIYTAPPSAPGSPTQIIPSSPPIGVSDWGIGGARNLQTWTVDKYNPSPSEVLPDWVISIDGRRVNQLPDNSHSVFVGDRPAIGTNRATLRTFLDDDFLGFVLGYAAGDTTNPAADYLILDWKAGDQFLASPFDACGPQAPVNMAEGMALLRVSGVPTLTELASHAEVVDCTDNIGTVTELARATNLGVTGWTANDFYDFEFEFDGTRLKVWVDGVLEFDHTLASALSPGNFGFYDFAQPNGYFVLDTEIVPTTYDMLNGETGSNNYRDDGYSGCPCLELAPLSGGSGELTDGFIAADNFNSGALANLPWVGWETIDPTITFNFDNPTEFGSVRVWVDDLDGDASGVNPPASVDVTIGTETRSFDIADPAGANPFPIDLPLGGMGPTTLVDITLYRQDLITTVPNEDDWIFVSEVEFFAPRSIQALVDAAAPGDTITLESLPFAVSPGSPPVPEWYNETVFIDKDLIIEGSGVTVDASGLGADIVDGVSVFTVEDGATVTFSDLTITGGTNSGALITDSPTAGVVTFESSTVTGNTSREFGGGINNLSDSTLTLDATEVSNNEANNETFGGAQCIAKGGGINSFADVNLTNGSLITGNIADGVGGGIHKGSSTLTISDSTVSLNEARNFIQCVPGGGSLGAGGGIWSDGGVVTVDGGTFSDNTTPGFGGGIGLINGATLNMNATSLATGNDAGGGGGGIWNNGSIVTIDGATISLNEANSGGGIRLAQPGAQLTVTGGNILANDGALGGGIYVGSGGTALVQTLSVIDGNDQGVYVEGGGSATINGSTISNNTSATGAGAYLEAGGQLTIQGTDVVGNIATDDGGGVYAEATAPNAFIVGNVDFEQNVASDKGGALAIFTLGCAAPASLCASIAQGRFTDNDSDNGGGAAWVIVNSSSGKVSFENSTFTGNEATSGGGEGGAILKEGAGLLTVDRSTFTGNVAGFAGGALTNWQGPTDISNSTFTVNEADPAGATGGAISHQSGDLTIANSFIGSNRSGGQGGGLHHTGGTVTILNTQIGTNYSGTTASFTPSGANGDGGGIWSDGPMEVKRSRIIGSIATGGSGGGVYASGPVSIDTTMVSGNDAVLGTGGLGDGGGIRSEGPLDVRRSSVILNTADGSGGGIDTSGGALIDNTTISGNQADGPGGGVHVDLGLSVTAINSATITENTAFDGGGIWSATTAPVEVYNTIISGNSAATAPDCRDAGVLINFFYNLVGDDTDCPGYTSGASTNNLPAGSDPMLGPLASNGGPSTFNNGPTPTHALLAGSAAIDVGDPGDTITFPDFSALPLGTITFNGSASIANEGGQDLLRTNAPAFTSGSAFITNPLPVDESFSTQFEFQVDPEALFGVQAGDGFTFIVADSPSFIGDAGGRLGIGAAVNNSSNQNLVAVEYDIFSGIGDHVGINVGADVSGDTIVSDIRTTVATLFPGEVLDNGERGDPPPPPTPAKTWFTWIDYRADINRLEVRLAQTNDRPTTPMLSWDVDIAAQVGLNDAYFGFTGASGSATAKHDILNWTLTTDITCAGSDQRGASRFDPAPCDIGAYEADSPQVFPVEYAMPNGQTSTGGSAIDFLDDGYPGCPCSPTDPLSGGTGELTDGVIARQNYQNVEVDQVFGPYVGWRSFDPVITFTFGEPVNLERILVHVDDNNNFGSVNPPASIDVTMGGAPAANYSVTNPFDATPFAIDLDVSALPPDDTVVLEINRLIDGGFDWVMVSEVEFFETGFIPVPPDLANFAYDVTPGSTEVGVAEVPITDIPIEAIVGGGAEGEYEASPLGAIPLGAIPLGAIDLDASPLGAIPLGAIPLGAIDVSANPLGAINLSSVPLGAIGTSWEEILSTPPSGLEGIPLQNITLAEVLALSDAGTRLAGIDLNDIALEASPLGAISLPSVALGDEPLLGIDPTLCDDPALGGFTCSDPATDTLFELEIASAPLGAIPLGAIPLGAIPLGAIPLGAIPLGAIPLGAIPLGAIPLGAIPLGAIPLGAIDLAGTPLGAIPLGAIDLDGTVGCDALGTLCTDYSLSNSNQLIDLINALEGASVAPEASPLGAIPLGAIPLGAIPLGAIDLLGAPLDTAPLGAIPLGAIPLGAIPLGAIDLAGTPLGAIPLGAIGDSWACDVLVAPNNCGTLPLPPDPTFYDLAVALEAAGESAASTPLGAITIADLPLGAIPLGAIPLGAIPLGAIPLGAIELAQSPLGAIPLGAIEVGGLFGCAALAAPYSCAELPVSDATTLADYLAALEAAAVPTDLAGTPLGAIPLGAIDLNSLPLGAIDLNTVELNEAPLGAIPLGAIGLGEVGIATSPLGAIPLGAITPNINAVVNCSLVDCVLGTLGDAEAAGAILDTATLGDLGEYGATTLGNLGELLTMEVLYGDNLLSDGFDYGNLSLGQILISLLLQSDFPWETLPLAEMGLQEIAPNSSVTYSASFDLTGDGSDLVGSLTAVMPEDFFYTAGSASVAGLATAAEPLADPTITELGTGEVQLTFALSLDPGDTYTVEWQAVPGFDTGDFLTQADVEFAAAIPAPAGPTTDDAAITVTEAFTGNNDFGTPASIADDTLVFSHIATPNVSDFFSFTAGPVGTRHAVFLSQFDQDTDLVLYQPETEPVSDIAPRTIPLGAIPIEDDGVDYGGNLTEEPELEPDINIESAPLGAISINRGTTPESAESTLASTQLTPGEPFTIQVSGYQGNASTSPYVVRIKKELDVAVPSCTVATFPHGAAGGINYAGLPAGLNTIFLVNEERLTHQYGATATADILASINAVIASGANGVVGAIVPVNDDSAVQTAYAAWDLNPCDPEAANAVVGSITSVIDQIQAARPTLTYVSIIGNDDIIPFGRLEDLTAIANESTYTEQFTDGALYGALLTRHFLSDDPYGDLDPIPWLDRFLHVPELSVGRLVESPADITLALDHFVTFNGELDPQTAAVAGYDFLDDGSDVVFERLANIYDPASAGDVASLIDAAGTDPLLTWDLADLQAFLDLADGSPGSTTADIFSVNAHSDHFRQLPSFGDANNDESDLFEVADLGPLPFDSLAGNIVFTMGCHAGLSVSDIGVGTLNTTDWAESYLGLGATYIANSGYGYGDTAGIALSERLMAEFAENLDGGMSIGHAMMMAKQEYFAQLGQYSVYDEKAMQQAIFYGLPMYALGATPPASPPPPLPVATDTGTGLEAATLSLTPTYETNSTPEGEFLSIEGQTQHTHYRPIQPLDTFDVTQDVTTVGYAHGAIVTEATTTDDLNVDPVYFTPNITGSLESEPEVPSDEIATPVFGLNIATYNRLGNGPLGEPFEQAQSASFIAGSFLSAADGSQLGTQRRTEEADVKVFYSPSLDFVSPRILSVDSVLVGNQVSFSVDATDDVAIAQVLALYRKEVALGESLWVTTELPFDNGTTYSGGGPVDPSGIVGGVVDFKIWVVDTAGNVSSTDFKNVLYEAPAPPPPQPGVALSLSTTPAAPPAPPSPWFDAPVTVNVTGEPGVTYDYTALGVSGTVVDGGTFPVPNDGVNEVVVSGGGDSATIYVLIDSTAPETPTVTAPLPGQVYVQGATAEFDFDCPDVGSGAVDCFGSIDGGAFDVEDGDAIDTSTPGTRTLTVVGTDIFNRSSLIPAVVEYHVVVPLELPGPSDPIDVNDQPIELATTITGVTGTTAEWDWGDETVEPATIAVAAPGTSDVTGSHEYAEPGVYPVTLTVDYGNGFVHVAAFEFVVIYDPAGGFVTGGGWIDSPAGAYTADPDLSGPANFGFVSKYKKGANVPTGNTTFKFAAGDFKFKSTTYDWLVIAGSRAQYKGKGLVNSQLAPNGTEYKFLLTGIDADVNQNDSHTEDKFRIKIWYEEAGVDVIVYDNKQGESDTSDAATVLGGGSIVIHDGKG